MCERHIDWLSLAGPHVGAWPPTQACVLTWNWTCVNFWVTGWHSIHWGTPARVDYIHFSFWKTLEVVHMLLPSFRFSLALKIAFIYLFIYLFLLKLNWNMKFILLLLNCGLVSTYMYRVSAVPDAGDTKINMTLALKLLI